MCVYATFHFIRQIKRILGSNSVTLWLEFESTFTTTLNKIAQH